ncbi:MAG: hypothetical protein IRZ07_27370 [Microbispora sp.]|nr:hypothetical protein [Microbispora sp.]
MSETFPIPDAYASESADIQRDEEKRRASPPSFFFAQTQALKLAANYFRNSRLQPSARGGVAAKHRHRIHGALFGQVMAAFEFCLKDFIAQIIDRTDMYDDRILGCSWIGVDVSRVLARRGSTGGVGGLLIHPLLGWHNAEQVNQRYKELFDHPLLATDEDARTLDRLWILRHSVVHNAGFVTGHDAYRLSAPSLSERAVRIDGEFVSETVDFLRSIVLRIESPTGTGVVRRWLETRAVGRWEDDEEVYRALRHVTCAAQSRTQELPAVTREMYEAALRTPAAGKETQ